MDEKISELIQDLLSIFFTKREVPNEFEVDTVERAINEVAHLLDEGILESYTYWIDRYKEEYILA